MKVKDIKNNIKQGKKLLKYWKRNRQLNFMLIYSKPLEELIKMAQRQVPKKVTFVSDEMFSECICPNCKNELIPTNLDIGFCEVCGQALRWKR